MSALLQKEGAMWIGVSMEKKITDEKKVYLRMSGSKRERWGMLLKRE